MPVRRMRIELFDGEGNKYKIAFEGHITREKALRLLDLVELLGGMPVGESNSRSTPNSELSKFDKVRMTIKKHFPVSWFSSKEVQSAYEKEFGEPVGLSTVATYLSRLETRGSLSKSGGLNRLRYRKTLSFPQAVIAQQVRR